MSSFSIQLHHGNNQVFLPGSQVQGVVSLGLDSEVKCRGLRLVFRGEEHTYWVTGSGKHRQTHTQTVVFFETRQTLFGFDKGVEIQGDYPRLQPGESKYQFSFLFPANTLPVSFEGGVGHVRYFVYAYIDRPWQLDTTSNNLFLTYVPIQIVDTPELLKPVGTSATKSTGVCIPSGDIVLNANLIKSGYLASEYIHVSGAISNLSSKVDVTRIEVILKQVMTFRAHYSSKTVETVVQSFTVPNFGLSANSGSQPFSLNMQLPNNIGPTLASQLNSNEYIVKVVAHVSGWWRTALKVRIPIFVGTAASSLPNVPKHQIVQMQISPDVPSPEPSAPPPAYN